MKSRWECYNRWFVTTELQQNKSVVTGKKWFNNLLNLLLYIYIINNKKRSVTTKQVLQQKTRLVEKKSFNFYIAGEFLRCNTCNNGSVIGISRLINDLTCYNTNSVVTFKKLLTINVFKNKDIERYNRIF